MIKAGSIVRVTHKEGILFSTLGVVEDMAVGFGDYPIFLNNYYHVVRFCMNGCHVTIPMPIDWLEFIK